MNDFKYYSDKNINAKEIIDLYASIGWGVNKDYDESSIKLMIKNTSSIIYARNEQGLLIGMIRIFSDFVITTYIAEIIVRPEYQKIGVGKTMMEKVKSIFKNTGVFFDTLPGVEGFAEKCGFIKKDNMSVFGKHFINSFAFLLLPFYFCLFTSSQVFSQHTHRLFCIYHILHYS